MRFSLFDTIPVQKWKSTVTLMKDDKHWLFKIKQIVHLFILEKGACNIDVHNIKCFVCFFPFIISPWVLYGMFLFLYLCLKMQYFYEDLIVICVFQCILKIRVKSPAWNLVPLYIVNNCPKNKNEFFWWFSRF